MVSTRRGKDKKNKAHNKSSKSAEHKQKVTSKKAERDAKKVKSKSTRIKAEKSSSKNDKKSIKSKGGSKLKANISKKTPAKKPEKVSKPASRAAEKQKSKVAAGSSYKGYTTDQYTKFTKLKSELESSTINDLKDILRKNGQKVTGTKPELIERVADGKVLGAIPKCPSCGGGRPKWDAKTGKYTCPGYMEDLDFINCHKKYLASELQRSPWQD